MIGAFESRAASSDATTVDDEVTLMAGMAKSFSWQYLKSFRTSSPLRSVSNFDAWKAGRVYVHDNAGLSRENFRNAHCEIRGKVD